MSFLAKRFQKRLLWSLSLAAFLRKSELSQLWSKACVAMNTGRLVVAPLRTSLTR